MTVQLPGERTPSTSPPTRRRYFVPLPPELGADALERLGDLVAIGHVTHLEIEAEDRDEARLIAAELIADAGASRGRAG
ncbi:MAG TPA: hypothetical protein VGD73_08300 [Pseudonocardia sp.]